MREELATLIKTLAKTSTCLKRSVVCVILDQNDNVLGFGANYCAPDNGICPRLGIYQNKAEYSDFSCNWEHAEVRAVKSISDQAILNGRVPMKAIVVGHDFCCPNCEETLKRLGVTAEVIPTGYGTGLK